MKYVTTQENRRDRCPRTGKSMYAKKEAQTKVNFSNGYNQNKKEGMLRIYQCPFCDYWHMTHKDDYFQEPTSE